jgi:dCTP deaminase
MILSNVEILKALDAGRLIIAPEPSPRLLGAAGVSSPYDTHSVDLTLGPEVMVPKPGQVSYDLTKSGSVVETIRQHSTSYTITEEQPFNLAPNRFILGRTRERVELPILPDNDTCLAARIEGKSSRARFGLLVHFTAPTVHPGFKGTLTLEIINLGPASVLLVPGMAIAQLIVEEVKGIPIQHPSQFQGQETPAG